MENKRDYVDFLKDVYFFRALGHREITKIHDVCREEKFEPGKTIFEEGDRAEKFFIILDGAVEVWKNYGTPHQDLLARHGRGGMFGEMALVDELPRSATVVACRPSTLLSISREDFNRILSEDGAIALSIMKALSSIVRKSNELFVESLKEKNLALEKANREVKAAQEELLRAERLSALGKFSSLILHDIKNPLSVLRLNAELILARPDDRSRVSSKAENILVEIDRLNRLATDLLDYSKGQIRLKKTQVRLQVFFSGLVRDISETFKGEGIAIETEFLYKEGLVMDEERMYRVFSNLATNARKAMAGGGTLSMRVADRADSVQFEVSDTGVGMSREELERAFEPFFSSGKGGGTGLGMTIAKSIVEAHGGSISIVSRKHRGTTVTILLPKGPSTPDLEFHEGRTPTRGT
jgi:signal transduction histidine kinase